MILYRISPCRPDGQLNELRSCNTIECDLTLRISLDLSRDLGPHSWYKLTPSVLKMCLLMNAGCGGKGVTLSCLAILGAFLEQTTPIFWREAGSIDAATIIDAATHVNG